MLRRLLLALVCGCPLWTADGAGTAVEPLEAHPVVVWNRTIAELRVGLEGLDVEQRVSRIERRIEQLPDTALTGDLRAQPITIGDLKGQVIYVGPDMIMALADADVEPGRDPAVALRDVQENLRHVLQARLDQRSPHIVLWGTIWSATATLAMLFAMWMILRIHRVLQARIAAIHQHVHLPHLGGLDPVPALRGIMRLVARAAAWLVVGFVLYTWLATVLVQFPYTHPLAEALGNHLLRFGRFLLAAVLGSLPGLGMVVVIVLLTRVAARALDSFFTSVEEGTITISWMEPDTAKATRRIAGAVLWLFAMTVAYPYVPGSSSDAFKGVSVFAGLLLTLGSAGMVNQMMSGLVVVYSRMMKPGDLVKVGDTVGRVIELGFLSTKVRTPIGHEVTLPNAILTGTSVSNYSRYDAATGPMISTAVTIGYDTPWRQVHGLLVLAASRTPGVVQTVKPEILQTALSDFYVEYQLRCRIERVEDRIQVLSVLHAQVLDAFNEFGVQIMSPHFVAQPAQNVLVPPDKRAPPPLSETSG
jgi:small-conductance mechanosensitive channel